jgi:hypothetical protein
VSDIALDALEQKWFPKMRNSRHLGGEDAEPYCQRQDDDLVRAAGGAERRLP